MIRYIKKAVGIVTANFPFVLIMAITQFYILAGGLTDVLALLVLISSFFIYPFVYGRLMERVRGERKGSYVDIMKKHWLNFLVVSLIVYLPNGIWFFFMNAIMSPAAFAISVIIIPAAISVVTIYVYPHVFLENRGVSAIPRGIKYLCGNIAFSMPLISLTALVFIMNWLVYFALSAFSITHFLLILGIGLAYNIISAFISLVVFVAACSAMVERLMPARG